MQTKPFSGLNVQYHTNDGLYHQKDTIWLAMNLISHSNSGWSTDCLWTQNMYIHDDVIKWKHIQRYWPFVRGIHRSPVNSPHKSQWRGALMFSLICAWTNGWVNNHAGDLRRHCAKYDVTICGNWSGYNHRDLICTHTFFILYQVFPDHLLPTVQAGTWTEPTMSIGAAFILWLFILCGFDWQPQCQRYAGDLVVYNGETMECRRRCIPV